MLGQEQQRKHWAREKDLTSAPRISQISNSQVLVPIVCWALYKHSQAVITAWDQADGVFADGPRVPAGLRGMLPWACKLWSSYSLCFSSMRQEWPFPKEDCSP